MIPQAAFSRHDGSGPAATARWQQALSDCITDPQELLGLLALDPALLPAALAADRSFRLRVPRDFVRRMQPGNPRDPLLRQVLPLGEELLAAEGFSGDPLAERQHRRGPGLLQKYRGRVLVIAAGACAVNCRYCFRRHYPYEDNTPDSARWEQILAELAADSSIDEVILSGGDPLLVSNRRLSWIVRQLDDIPHLQRLRIHTRLPVVIPDRVDEALPGLLTAGRLRPVMVVHANHPQEIDAAVRGAMERLAAAGVTLLNQAVLLRGVNDEPAALEGLSRALFAARVLPYYLHLLDPVAGAAHFEVPEEQALVLMRELTASLPGYLVPRLVREIPDRPAKTPVVFRW
ncbi:MAG: EF-P beta-lysylation protein EpmB [Pseudomonadota bacterium]